MGLSIELHGDREIIADFKDADKRVQKASVRAINRAMASARTVMSRGVAKDAGLKYGDVLKAMTLKEATFQDPVAKLTASRKALPLIVFKAKGLRPSRGKGSGVSVQIFGKTFRYPHAFIATMPTGHEGVFERVAGANRRGPAPNRSQLPIKQRFGPSLWQAFQKHRPEGLARANEVFATTFDHELEFRKGGDAGTD